MTHLLLTVRFLDDRYHGLLDRGGPPEWPPSPFRLFQALVAGVARRGELVDGDDVPSNTNFKPIGQALGWLQQLTRDHPPIIIAPKSRTGQAITRFVPNNDGDKKFDRQERLTGKHTEPTLFLLEPDQKPEVHYVWEIDVKTDRRVIADIERAARSLTTLGWGIDMAFADARLASMDNIQKLKGIRWYPKKNAGSFRDTLRTPTYDNETGDCTLCDLRQCHDTFINRIVHGKPLKTVQKPRVFDRVLYTSIERSVRRPHAVFRLVDDDGEMIRPGYPHAKLIHIAGMVRHLAIEAMKNDAPPWLKDDPDWVNRVVRGKRDETEGDQHKQFSYVPLPTIGHPHADAMIRNVMIVAPLGMERELNYLAERLDGLVLQPERHAVMCDGHDLCHTDSQPAPLPRIELQKFTPPTGKFKFIAERYLGKSDMWETVTPVILDGCNGKSKTSNPEKSAELTVKLICKALARAGIETPCEFTWQSLPFFKNALSAHKYDRQGKPVYFRPNYLQGFNAVHLRIRFEAKVPGPITIGAGRHCGFGLFATSDILRS